MSAAFILGYYVGYLITICVPISLMMAAIGKVFVTIEWHESTGRKLLKYSVVILCSALAVWGFGMLVATLFL